MEIIYLVLLFACSISFLMLKKSNEKLNLISWIAITAVLTMCYNIVVVFILSSLNIKSTLITLSIINIVFLCLINFKNYKNKEFQKFYINRKDVIFTLLILGIVIAITIVNFKPTLCLKYKSVDAASHYTAAREFYRNSMLLNKVEKTTVFDYSTHMPATYINIGILFKVFSNIIGEINLYNIYILFDMFMLFIIGLVFYALISDKLKGKSMCVAGAIFITLFMIGYPLNTIIYGFSYLTFNLVIITTILKVIPYFSNNELDKKILIAMSFLLTFAVFFSYYLFAPAVYASIFIYYIIIFKKQGKIINLSNIMTVFITLIIPTICGFIYFVLPGIFDEAKNNFSAITAEGTMYRDVYSNFIFFIPFIIYYFIDKLKKKEFNFEIVFLTLFLCFMGSMFIGGMLGKVSSYYYFKNYYVLWIISLYISFQGYYILSREKSSKIFCQICLVMYCILIISSVLLVERRISEKASLFIEKEKLQEITDIYYTNIRECVSLDEQIFNEERLELVKKISDLEDKDNIEIDGALMEKFFIYAILDVYGGIDENNKGDWFYDIDAYSTEKWLETDKRYYLILFYEEYVKDVEENPEQYKILYKNETGALLERIK